MSSAILYLYAVNQLVKCMKQKEVSNLVLFIGYSKEVHLFFKKYIGCFKFFKSILMPSLFEKLKHFKN